ncbi:flagellar basal body P-ring formation chaperone FlgA [Pseudoxanthomonas sp. X-1]|uniref:flagellar basal body P-ring formation chaperone FlgA n=1 Tax=Pseudoxanthomonas sp. X-1 TaxID=2571115 RepID=UPI000DB269C7|nr:flagellar basal body P-ring formation chaperone FlgA [Pseudoxanthomonas sp. X-1]PZP64135.1 MAG: flagella basal body P-ring formation protein FlgA [Pseudoxanthomonas spadix]TMN17017.1 flagellar basal body P-ring formation protein FlgA [Pseudoxanthomonas sp. X-1]UAY74000.1 flagellar basal body P-ring formation chaperone FlgA [Pseudoxanthomonas sp. X-1]
MNRCLASVVLSLAALAPGTGRAADLQSLDAVRAAALQAVGGPQAQGEARLDNALRLVACTRPLQAVAQGTRMAQVRCDDAPGWKLFVPVTVRREADVVVAGGPVRPGDPVANANLVVQRRDLGTTEGATFASPEQLAGAIAARALSAGDIVTAGDLQQGQPLRRGDPVVLVSRVGGAEIRMPGVALGNAQAGQRVAVQNSASNKVVRGRVSLVPGEVDVVQ